MTLDHSTRHRTHADKTATARVEPLTPLDYVYFEKPQYTMSFLFDFPVQQDFDAMRASLARVLERFYPLKGRIELGAHGTYQIVEDVSNPWGAAVFEVRDHGADRGPEVGNQLLPLSEGVGPGPGGPIAKFVLHQFCERSVLSTSVTHTIADGFSYFFFLASWAAETRGVQLPGPAHQRKLVGANASAHGDLSPAGIFARTGYSLLDRSGLDPQALRRYESVRFSDAELQQHRDEAERELGHKVSVNDIVTALLLKDCATRWHQPGDSVRLTCQYDMRRLLPNIEPLFFGNCTRGASFDASFDDIVHSSPGRIAKLVKQAVACIDRTAAEDSVSCLQRLSVEQGLSTTRKLHVWHPDFGSLVTNLTRMPLDQVNFGRGGPRDFFAAGSHSPRTYILIKRAAGVEAFVGLS